MRYASKIYIQVDDNYKSGDFLSPKTKIFYTTHDFENIVPIIPCGTIAIRSHMTADF